MRPSRSNLTRTAGQFWRGDGIWNTVVEGSGTAVEQTGMLHLATGSTAPYLFFIGPGGWPHSPQGMDCPSIVVDLTQRTVVSAARWSHDPTKFEGDATGLDGDGWGSLAAGLILEREILRVNIEHAVGVLLPDLDLFGKHLWAPTQPSRGSQTDMAIHYAIHRYGLICTGYADVPTILAERSVSASSPDDPGKHYRDRGIGQTLWPINLRLDQLHALER